MKYQGVMVLSIRTYLGCYTGEDAWQHHKYIVGTKEEGKIKDYKTGEIYDYIPTDKYGCMMITRDEVKKGNVYAISSVIPHFDKSKAYSAKKIDKFIDDCNWFSKEYKNIGKQKRGKVLMKSK